MNRKVLGQLQPEQVSDEVVLQLKALLEPFGIKRYCTDGWGAYQKPPFSKGTLVNFRKRLIDNGLDRRLVECTVEIAKEKGGFKALAGFFDHKPGKFSHAFA